MRKLTTYALAAAAVVAPLYLATPAEAQNARDIQRMEERLEDAKRNGNWNDVSQMERDLNVARLQYQRRNGLGENQSGPYYDNNNWNNRWSNRDRWNNNRDWRYDNNRRGYYDPWGNWRY